MFTNSNICSYERNYLTSAPVTNTQINTQQQFNVRTRPPQIITIIIIITIIKILIIIRYDLPIPLSTTTVISHIIRLQLKVCVVSPSVSVFCV